MYDDLVKRLRVCPNYTEACVSCPHEHDLGCRTTTMHEAADAIEKLSKPKWIPVTERLPDSSTEYVLCCGSKGGMFVGWAAIKTYDGSGKCTGFQNSGKGRSFTHWMPLPEPPKGEI